MKLASFLSSRLFLFFFVSLSILLFALIWFVSAMPFGQRLKLSEHPEIQAYVHEVASQHHFDEFSLKNLFEKVRIQPKVVAAISRPYEGKTWDVYQHLFVTDKRVNEGVVFLHAHDKALKSISSHYGIPPEVIVAILGIETRYGHYPLPYRAIDALTTLAFNYPKRSNFFKSELTQLLLLAREQHINPLVFRSSYAGALGTPQFMPSSYRKYAIGFRNPHHADLIHNVNDSISSIANYLHFFGWKAGGKIATPYTKRHSDLAKLLTLYKQHHLTERWLAYPNFYVIMTYNTSPQYAMAVYQLAQKIKTQSAVTAE